MPWNYTLQLSRYESAHLIQSDWESNLAKAVEPDLGGVTVSGNAAAIITQDRESDYEYMESMSYVTDIQEWQQIPDRADPQFNPPIEIHPEGIYLME